MILVACVVAIIMRVVLRRAWLVIASSSEGARYTLHIVGWRRSRNLVREIASGIEAGLPPSAIEGAALQP